MTMLAHLGMGFGLSNWAQLAQGAAGGGVVLESGTVYGTEGAQYGFTDFSEFSVGAGDVTGITFWGTTGDEEPTRGIANDATEGNYHYYTQGGFDVQMYGIDAFDAVGMSAGEMLARIYLPTNTTFDKNIGPAMRITGDGTDAARRMLIGHVSTNLTPDSAQCFRLEGGSATLQGTATAAGDPFTRDAWVWTRFRVIFDDPTYTVKVKVWSGAIGDEPVSWDLDDAGNTLSTTPGDKIGWGQLSTPVAGSQRIAYLAFSEDPDTTPPPTP